MRWVKQGLIWRSLDPRPQDEADWPSVHQAIYDRCDTRFFDYLEGRLAEVESIDATGPLPSLPVCDCGCLLASPDEPCPACLAWAIEDAIRQSWHAAQVPYTEPILESEAA